MNKKSSDLMEKQIMDLSNSHSTNLNQIIIPSYDFLPIHTPFLSSNFDTDEAPVSHWTSFDSKTNTSSFRNYASLDEPVELTLGNNHKPVDKPLDVSMVSEIDRIIKKHVDNLMHAMDGVSSRVTQLETRTRNLEHLVDDLKVSVENSHGDADGRMRQLENTLREVQTGVKFIRDKQEIAEACLQKVEQAGIQNIPQTKYTRPGASGPPNAPHPPPQQNYQPTPPQQTYQLLLQDYPPNHGPSVPQHESYFRKQNENPENLSQQYEQLPLPQPHHCPPPNQYPPLHQTPYSQSLSSSQPYLPTSSSSLQPPSSHHPQEMQYSPSSRVPTYPSQHSYGLPPSTYEPSYMRPGPEKSGSFGSSAGNLDTTYAYSSSSPSFGSGYPVKPLSGVGQLPTARILPQPLPTASGIGGGSGSSGSGNKVPIDDVVDKVTNMGFPRDLVRATVRKLTENGQAVDLNVVLDKLMNDGDGQGWYGR